MKHIFFILGLFIFTCTNALCAQKFYTYQNPYFYNRAIMRPTYNPYNYNSYYNQYNYRKYNKNNRKRIERLNKIRKLNRIKNNFLSWNFNKNNNNFTNGFSNGNLTGYSVPITGNSAFFKDPASRNCNTELFSAPSGNEIYYSNGEYFKDNQELGGKAGVRIIYD